MFVPKKGWSPGYIHVLYSGGSRNLERGVQSLARKARRKIFWVAMPTFGHANAIKYSWKAEPRGLSQKKSRTLSDSVVLVNYNFN